MEKTRMVYVAVACAAVLMASAFDILHYTGFTFPPMSNLFIAGLLYFILIVTTHPRLPELYEIMARAVVVLVITLFAIFVFYLIIGLFGTVSSLQFTPVLVASFLIVVFVDSFKLILKKVFGYFFPESRDLFRSIYGFEEELEKEKSVLLEEMASTLAHEIKNPLGSIKGAGQVLRSDTNNPETEKLLDVIIEETDRLNSVVSQFLNYARPYPMNLKLQNLNGIIERAISVIGANNQSGRIVIEKELNTDLPQVYMDGEQIIQVILNIAFNALEAMSDGGVLTFRTSKIESDEGEAVGITIRDSGKGISRENMKNIFKPFFTTKERGVGLGLAICQKIVRNHKGYIRVKSLPEQGTIFYIRLPLPR
jgi:two-component system, NtrC family, sensor histidine kinase HydH